MNTNLHEQNNFYVGEIGFAEMPCHYPHFGYADSARPRYPHYSGIAPTNELNLCTIPCLKTSKK